MPTRVDGYHGRRSILDHIHTNKLNFKYNLSIIESTVSDHNLLMLGIFHPDVNIDFDYVRSKFINFDEVAKDLNDSDLVDKVSFCDFYDLFNTIIKRHSYMIFFANPKRNFQRNHA